MPLGAPSSPRCLRSPGEAEKFARVNGLFGRRWWSWQRIACLGITAAILTFIFRKIDAQALRDALVRVQFGWFAAAFSAYGIALLLGGLRWHITLQAIRCVVHVAASVRLTCIGHFFFLIFFGAAAGDIAKSALYARWYRFGVPELAASAPIDRALGAVAALLVGGAAVMLGFLSGGFENLAATGIHLSTTAMIIAVAIIAVFGMAFLFWKPAGESWWA